MLIWSGLLLLLALVAGIGVLATYAAAQLVVATRLADAETPEAWGLPTPTPIHLTAEDGHAFTARWFALPGRRPSVVACHGHGGNWGTMLWSAAILLPRMNVLLLDARGHGESLAPHTSIGYLERLDVAAAARWLHRTTDEPVGVFGVSMGGATAILAAADEPAISAVAADCPFARLTTPMVLRIHQVGIPMVFARPVAHLARGIARLRLGLVRKPWLDPIDAVGYVAPRSLLLIHGSEDADIPVSEAHLLWERAGNPKELWEVAGAGHAEVANLYPREYAERVCEFFARALGDDALASSGKRSG